jgi:phosphoglycolate phosphatase
MEREVIMSTEKTPVPRPRAVIFDWDDTIVDNWPLALEALNAALTHMGLEPWSDAEARGGAGGSARDIFTKMFGDRWQEADKVFYDTFNKLVENNVRIHDHVEDMLQSLRDNGVYLAVVSNKRGALLRKEAEAIGYTHYFNKIVGAGDAAKDKPNVDPVHLALQGSGIQPGPDVWFIGDSHIDMICALNTGCTGILLETKLPPADLLAKHPPKERFKDHKLFVDYIRTHFK